MSPAVLFEMEKNLKKVSLHTRVPSNQLMLVSFDAAANNKTLDVVVQAALSYWFKLNSGIREEVYKTFPDKIYGSPQKSKKNLRGQAGVQRPLRKGAAAKDTTRSPRRA